MKHTYHTASAQCPVCASRADQAGDKGLGGGNGGWVHSAVDKSPMTELKTGGQPCRNTVSCGTASRDGCPVEWLRAGVSAKAAGVTV